MFRGIYKDHGISVTTTSFSGSGLYQVFFSVYRKRGDDWEIVHDDKRDISGTFFNVADAEAAAFSAARKWIDDHATTNE